MMDKSVSGFDIGTSKAVGSFFSSIRQKHSNEQVNFHSSEKMKGEEFIEHLIR